ncbi:unannotated protein [freshwater metagenome]|uniref:Unannotated protein n=1 Tax=freshwater metagenome TaxID=449393 RepID=A0A6J7NTU6_9ZZZZ
MYSCSTPTAPGGKLVVVFGKVDCTGGIVAKSVGPTGTTVVAVPVTSTPHDVSTQADTINAVSPDFKLLINITIYRKRFGTSGV